MRTTEHQHQTALMNWASKMASQRPELAMVFAIPNGGDRHVAVGGRLKAEGVKRGVPDLFLPVPQGAYHGLFVELKAEGGRATPEQRAWLEALSCLGYRAELCHGWDQAREVIADYLGMPTT